VVVVRKGAVSLISGPVRAISKIAVMLPGITLIVVSERAVSLKSLSIAAVGEGPVVLAGDLSRRAVAEQKKRSEHTEKVAYHSSLLFDSAWGTVANKQALWNCHQRRHEQ
jgi:hypothetical protein